LNFTIDLPDVEAGLRGPFLSDRDDQPFHWPLRSDGQTLSFEPPAEPFGVNVFWRRPGLEPIWITADAAGAHYRASDGRSFSLADELLRGRAERNRAVLERYGQAGFSAPVEVREKLAEASARRDRLGPDATPVARAAALARLVEAGEALELAYARSRPVNRTQHIGCDVRQMYLTHPERFRAHFNRLFDYSTVVFYVKSRAYEYFEPTEGEYRFELRDLWISWLERAGMVIEGRPVLWFHSWVTPEWLERKSYAEIRQYALKHARDLVGRYRGRVSHWEVINEAHDWANRLNLSHDEVVELTRYACQLCEQFSPGVVRIVNNTDCFGAYARHGKREDGVAVSPQWTPYTFLRDLVRAEVPFEVSGVQLYRPYRDLSDMVRAMERYEALGKSVYLTEIGVPGTDDGVHAWTPEAQADWAEKLYRVLMPRPGVGGLLWYDFTDRGAFLPDGGLVDQNAEPKPAFERIERLLVEAGRIPESRETVRTPADRVAARAFAITD
jgi:endo-1,4-beta-xylanase